MKYIRLISRILVGIVFIFSGFVKAVDPLGSTYKFIDYFDAFKLDFLSGIALPLAITLSTVELLLGIAMFLNIRMKLASWIILIFMSFFTVLTFILAIYNPVSDCGCFGDAIILTNWQTFWKNIILFAFVLIVFFARKQYNSPINSFLEWGIISVTTVFILFLSIYALNHLPPLDFRPYNVGTYIPEKMIIPEGMPLDEYETILVYQKDGVKKEFDLENYPWQDSTWTWVETKQELIRKGYEPPIHDFTISSNQEGEITERVLKDEKYSFLFITYKMDPGSLSAYKAANEISIFCEQNPYFSFYCMTASTPSDIKAVEEKIPLAFNIYTTDEITLKTIVRSNPGLVLIKDGTIIAKWHKNDFPDVNQMNEHYLAEFLNASRQKNEQKFVYIVVLLFALSILAFRNIIPHKGG